MRARELKPGFFTNEILASLPFEVRILFAGLWCAADRCGRLEDRPRRIQAEIFPYDQTLDVDAMLWKLEEAWFIYRYTVQGSQYIQIAAFFRHQRPHPKEKESIIPPLPCDLTDSKACREKARTSREKVVMAGRGFGQDLQDLQGLQVLPGSPPQVATNPVATCAPSQPEGAATPKPAKAPRKSKADLQGWPEWKLADWRTIWREDPKAFQAAGAVEKFGAAVQTEEQGSYLVELHRRQIAAANGGWWPGLGAWLTQAVDAMHAGLKVEEARPPGGMAVVPRERAPTTFGEAREKRQAEIFEALVQRELGHDIQQDRS